MKKFTKGFTLIELLVVISIIGMLSSVVLASLQTAREKGRIGAGVKFAAYNYHAFGADAFALYDFEDTTPALFGYYSNVIPLVDKSGNNRNLDTCDTVQKTNDVPRPGGYSGGFTDYSYCARTFSSPYSNLSNAWTATLWVKSTGYSSFNSTVPLIQVLNSSSQRLVNVLMHYPNATTIGFQCGQYISAGTDYINTTGLLSFNKWYHIACTYDGTNHALYIDGKKVATQAAPANVTRGVVKIEVGELDTASLVSDSAIMDDVAIYTQALPTAAIEKMYAAGLPAHVLAQAP